MKSEQAQAHQPKKLRVVIADDSVHVRESLTSFIRGFGQLKLVGEAEDGIKAIEAVRQLQPDLLILDISMPRMNGLEVLQALKEKGGKCRVFILTGESRLVYRQKCLELGAAGFFEKAGQFDEFFTALKELRAD